MDSTPMPQFQNGTPSSTGLGVSMPPVQSQTTDNGSNSNSPLPMVQQVEVRPEPKKDIAGLVKTIVIILLSLTLVTFIGLFIWMYTEYREAQSNLDEKISRAMAEAKDEEAKAQNEEFLKREKNPLKSFAGPVDYGELNFKYPKTWSLYVESDASNGGDYKAYLNPGQVDPISNENVNALRVSILDKAFDTVAKEYENRLKDKNRPLSMESVTVNGVTANLYTGSVPNTQFQGFVLIFKIRDKTAILQTDSVLFEEDFKALIETIKFNA